MKFGNRLTLSALLLMGVCAPAHATRIDSATATLSGGTKINFEGLPDGTPVGSGVYSGVTFSQPDGGRPQIDNLPFLFQYDASSGVGVLTGSMEGGAPFPTVAGLRVTFDAAQSAVEAYFSDLSPLGSYQIFAYGSGGTLLDSFTISGEERYVGFSGLGDIFAVQFGPSSAFGDAFAIDDLTYIAAPSSVPEASTWGMMLLGFGAIGFAMRRKGTAIRLSIPA